MAGPFLFDRVRETSSTNGTGTLTLAGAATGYRSFSVVGNANTCYYVIANQTGTEWEVGIGTYTSSGTTLSRDAILSSSNSGSAVNFSSGTKDVFIDVPAALANPGFFNDFRLTTETGVPVSTSDRTARGTIYLTSAGQGNRITLPVGAGKGWKNHTVPSDLSYAVSATDATNYDLFAWDNAGTVTLARGTAWTSGTARVSGSAGELTTLDGRLVNKYAEGSVPSLGGLYLGTFRADGTNTVADASSKRFLWSYYNRVHRSLVWRTSSADSDSTASWHVRLVSGSSTGNQIAWVTGLAVDALDSMFCVAITAGANSGFACATIDASSPGSDVIIAIQIVNSNITGTVSHAYLPQIGYHYINPLVYGGSGVTFSGHELSAHYRG